MGVYINPAEGKEAWLMKHGIPLAKKDVQWDDSGELVLVCVVDNGLFKSAAVAYKKMELEYFLHREPTDTRPKQWFLVEVKKLLDPAFGANVDSDFERMWRKAA